MADFPGNGGVGTGFGGVTLTASRGVAFSAGNGSKGTYVELIAATTGETNMLMLDIKAPIGGDIIVDVSVGAGGSEEVIVSNLYVSEAGDNKQISGFPLPVSIPDGSRVSIRAQCTDASQTVQAACRFFAGSFMSLTPISQILDYGVNTSTAEGTAVDPGGTINTKGAWIEITASMDESTFILMTAGTNQNTDMTSAFFLFDIGIGGAGSEVIIEENIIVYASNTETVFLNHSPLPISIPDGSRISVKCQSDINDATDRILDVAIYGGK